MISWIGRASSQGVRSCGDGFFCGRGFAARKKRPYSFGLRIRCRLGAPCLMSANPSDFTRASNSTRVRLVPEAMVHDQLSWKVVNFEIGLLALYLAWATRTVKT